MAARGHPLADRWRPVVLPAIFLAIVGIAGLWVYLPTARSPLDACVADPKVCAGQAHTLHLVRVGEPRAAGVVPVRTASGVGFEIVGRDPSLVAGTIVTATGTFDDEGRLRLASVRTHPWRRHKAVLGLLGAFATPVLLIFAFVVRREPEGWRLVPRFGGGEA